MTLVLLNSILIFVLGTIMGSFYNVVGYRLPNNMSIVFPNSFCPNCNKKLKFYELIPVFSYLFQRGKCNNCKKKVSILYPIFELITGIIFLICYLRFGLSFEFIYAITFSSILIIITISDLRYFIIPDEVLLTGVVILMIELLINSFVNNIGIVNGIVIPLLNGLGSFSIIYLFKFIGDIILKKECLGGGDIKLLFVIGFAIGFDMSIVAIFLAAFIALPLSIISLIKKDENVLPFGPYLSIASLIILFTNLNLEKIFEFFAL